MKTKKLGTAILCLAVITNYSYGEKEEKASSEIPKLMFYLPFDETVGAKMSGGTPEPVKKPEDITFVPGKKGKALELNPGRGWKLTYLTKDNLDLSAGTIAFWVKYPKDFSEHRTGKLFETGTREMNNSIELKFFWHTRGKNPGFSFMGYFFMKRINPERFEICDWYSKIVKEWKPDEWHHVMIVWDTLRGVAKYFDGKVVGGPPTKNGPFSFPEPAEEMKLGPANLVIDEFRIYDKPMTPAKLYELTGLPPGDDFSKQQEVKYFYVKGN